MRLGVMAWGGNYYAPFPLYANWVKAGSPKWLDSTGHNTQAVDAAGLVLRPKGEYGKLIAAVGQKDFLAGGYPIFPSGRVTLLWDGPGYARLNFNGVRRDTDDLAQRVTGQATGNRKVYPNVAPAPGYNSPSIDLTINCDGGAVTNLRVYDKYVDPSNPPKFHPLAFAKMQGVKFFRAKDALGIDNGCPIREFSDHTSQQTASIADGWGMPVGDVVDLCNTLRCGLWYSFPHLASDQYCRDAAAFIRDTLAPDLPVIIEFSNEVWNYGGSYPQSVDNTQRAAAYRLTKPGNPVWDVPEPSLSARYYVLRSVQIRDLVKPILPRAELTLNAQWSNGTYTLNYARNCADLYDGQGRINGEPGFTGPAQFERLCVAPYYEGKDLTPLAKQHAANAATLNATGRSVKLDTYEASLSILADDPDPAKQSLANVRASLSPDAGKTAAAYLSLFDSLGYDVFIWNGLAGQYVSENGKTHCYQLYSGLEQQDGDGTANAAQLAGPAPPDVSRCVSPIGAAFHAFLTPPMPPVPLNPLTIEAAKLRATAADLAAQADRLDAMVGTQGAKAK